MLTLGYLNTVWNVDEFTAMDCTLNIVSKCRFFYLVIRGLRKGPAKIFYGGPGKVQVFLSVKEWEPCFMSVRLRCVVKY